MFEVQLKIRKSGHFAVLSYAYGTEISVTFSKTSVMVQQLNLRTPWHEVKEKLKENDISLTDEDLEYEPGREDELLERLQEKMHKNKDDIRRYIESVAANESKAG